MLLSFSFACNSDQNESEHNHGPNGHSHGPARLRTDQTIWTNHSELFVEYPLLVVGKPSRFAAHFTILNGHKPIEEGSVKVTLKNSKGEQYVIAESPSSSGIFKPTITPKNAGDFTLLFEVKTPTFQDVIEIEQVQVYASVQEANKANPESQDDKSITFLKEQAWKMEFQTVAAKKQSIYDVVKTSGVWKTSPADKKQMVATVKGIVEFSNKALTQGVYVKKGETLLTINSKQLTANNLNAEIQNAEVHFKASKQEFERKKALFAKHIIAKSEFEATEKRYQISKTNYETLKSGYSSAKGKQIRAPFDGILNTVIVKNGDFVREGDALFTLFKTNSSLLETYVNPSYYSQLNTVSNIWYQAKEGVWSSLADTEGQIQSINPSVSKDNPLVNLFVHTNALVEQPNGSYTEVHIAIGEEKSSVVIPEKALLEDYGQYSVIVQTSGESFERRSISIGRQNGNTVEILSGLNAGEVVVSTGAYQVKMASMSGQAPAHGHAH